MEEYTPIVPSSLLEEESESEFGTFKHQFNNFSLKTGVIVKSYEVESEFNVNGLGPEYDVAVTEQDEDRGTTQTVYQNCTYIDSFGGVGDFLEVRRRTATDDKYKSDQDPAKTNGATVLLMCLDGVSSKAIILGGVKHAKRESVLTEENGTHLEGEFNGVNWKIDKDGAFTMTFKSATDNEGVPQDEEAGGSYVKIEKDGSIEVSDGNGETARLDKTTKKITVTSDDDMSFTTKKNFNVTATESVNVKATKDLIASAEGKANISIKSTLDVKADGPAKFVVQNLQIQSKNAIDMQASANIIINGPTVAIGPSPLPALILTTQFLGTGNFGAPVLSQPIGPFSSSVLISS